MSINTVTPDNMPRDKDKLALVAPSHLFKIASMLGVMPTMDSKKAFYELSAEGKAAMVYDALLAYDKNGPSNMNQAMPSMSFPSMPQAPQTQQVALPPGGIPQQQQPMGMPQMPGMPQMGIPQMQLPQAPAQMMPQMQMPGMAQPSMPGMGLPQAPGGMGLPQMSGGMNMPQAHGGMNMPQPHMQMPQMPTQQPMLPSGQTQGGGDATLAEALQQLSNISKAMDSMVTAQAAMLEMINKLNAEQAQTRDAVAANLTCLVMDTMQRTQLKIDIVSKFFAEGLQNKEYIKANLLGGNG